MVWDATAYNVTIKAIGTVESNMGYGSVNPSDPITIGLIQWFGTRAAALLFRIKNEATTAYNTYCPATIKTAMSSHPATDTWWNTRHVTKEEITGLKNLLTRAAVKAIQNNQTSIDIDAYLVAANAWGLDKNTETLATEFFCTVYNQSPQAASQIANNLPAHATLDNIYNATLNNSIVGPYRNRQQTAYNIIKTQDSSGVDTSDGPTVTDGPDGGNNGGSSGTGGSKLKSANTHITRHGHVLHVHRKDGSVQRFYKSGGMYLAADDPNTGSKYDGGSDDPVTPPDPTGGTSTDAADAANKIVAWAKSKLGSYSYSQGPGRMNPDKSGYCDCSSFCIYAYQHAANIALNATYTGNLCTKGRLIKNGKPLLSELNLADLIFINWGPNSPSTWDHVEMYSGGGKRISMGRTPGPTETAWDADIDTALANGGKVQIRRYLT